MRENTNYQEKLEKITSIKSGPKLWVFASAGRGKLQELKESLHTWKHTSKGNSS